MRKNIYFPYFVLGACLFFIISLPKAFTERVRFFAVAAISPTWERLDLSKTASNQEIALLQWENQNLKQQLEGVYEWLLFEQRFEEQVERLKIVSKQANEEKNPFWKDFFQRRGEELHKNLELRLQAIPTKVIFREPASWSSSIWINVGQQHNASLGFPIVGKNSPVVRGNSLIGVVEYVGDTQSRVRLITDSGLVPSVRAVRGETQNRELLSLLLTLIERLHLREDLFESEEEKTHIYQAFAKVREKCSEYNQDFYLAKGELMGSSHPLWRSRGEYLRGIGFNYDYEDQEGPARDLISGQLIGEENIATKEQPILRKGDLLMTTGMDGVFPPGLYVAIVTKILEVQEGSYSYEIEARATAGDLDDLNSLFVLPPLGFHE